MFYILYMYLAFFLRNTETARLKARNIKSQ